MLSDNLKTQIQSIYNELESAGFKKRKPQMLLIGKAASAAAAGLPFVAEAPTGTGKTAAYSLSLIPVALDKGEPLIISTATIALQNQLLDDLQSLKDNTSLAFDYAQAKGRNNFYCPSAVDKVHEQGSVLSDEEYQQIRKLGDKFQSNWDGDFEHYPDAIDGKIQARCTSTSASCNKRSCSYTKECPYYANLDLVRNAHVVVANHALTAAMAEMGFGVYLTGGEHEVKPLLAVDEAHHIHDIYRDAMTASLALDDTAKSLKSSVKFAKDLSAYPELDQMPAEAESIANNMAKDLVELNSLVGQIMGDEKNQRFERNQMSEHFVKLVTDITNRVKPLKSLVVKFSKFASAEQSPVPSELAKKLDLRCAIAESILESIKFFQEVIFSDTPQANWFSQSRLSSTIYACPLSIADLFNTNVLQECHSVTFVSATLRSNGSFEHFCQRLGLPEQTNQLVVPSPFDPKQANLHLTKTGFQVNDPQHITSIAKQAETMFKDGEGSMVLFSSWAKLNAFKDALSPKYRNACLVQGEYSRNEITRRHKAAVDKQKTSIVLGLQSFGEGIDYKGKYLTSLVIPQIPFTHVNDPITAAETDFIKANGGNPFAQIQLPEATIKLVQWCGRLLRTESDTGNIYLFDNRISEKHYGKGILATLPDYQRAA